MEKQLQLKITKIKLLCSFCAEKHVCFCGKDGTSKPCEHVYVLRDSKRRLCPRWQKEAKLQGKNADSGPTKRTDHCTCHAANHS